MIISFAASGIDEIFDSLSSVQKSIAPSTVLSQVSSTFSARLRAVTPLGISGKLRDAVLTEPSGSGEYVVGYSRGVETAGDQRLDSVLSYSARAESVLRWVRPDELSSVLAEAFSSFATEGTSFIESGLVRQLDGST